MGGKLRNLWPVLWVVVVAGGAAWVLYTVWRSPQRNDLATYGAFAVALVALVAGWIAWAWRRRTKQQARTPGL
jgi:membrane protein DedA with SNARE-associated domain